MRNFVAGIVTALYLRKQNGHDNKQRYGHLWKIQILSFAVLKNGIIGSWKKEVV